MSESGKSGSLGTTQLMAFVGAAQLEAVQTLSSDYPRIVVHVGDVAAATEYLRANPSPEILLIEVPSAEAAPALLDALADVVNPHTKVLVTGTIDSYRFYHWLMDLGIHEYVLQPFTADQLKAAIVKGSAKKAAAAQTAEPQKKTLIAVIGTRGGVGATTVATNLAAYIAREYQQSTALIDLDYYFGTIALGMDMEPSRGMRDALEKPDRVDAMFLERVMVKPFAHLSLLAAEEQLHEVIPTQANAGEAIFGALKENFSTVVVDVPRQMTPLSRYVLAHADHVIMVATPQLPDFRDALRIRDYLVDQMKRPGPKVLLNRVGEAGRDELSASDFKKHYGDTPYMKLSHMPEAFGAAAKGELLWDIAKLKQPLAPLKALAAECLGKDAEAEEAAEKNTKKSGSFFSKGKNSK